MAERERRRGLLLPGLAITGAGGLAFVSAPGRPRTSTDSATSPSRDGASASFSSENWRSGPTACADRALPQDDTAFSAVLLLSVTAATAAGAGVATGLKANATSSRGSAPSRRSRVARSGGRAGEQLQDVVEAPAQGGENAPAAAGASATVSPSGTGIAAIDWLGTKTPWDSTEAKNLAEFAEFDLPQEHAAAAVAATALFLYQCVRIASHQPPSIPEVWAAVAVYLPWIAISWRDTSKLESHYQVTSYASCGWAVLSLTSLVSVVYQDIAPTVAFSVLAIGNVVFAAACAYFYSYHWTRMWRHYTQNRFRPLWIPGLLGLMLLHVLTPLDFAKRLDDGGWWKIVCQIYPDQWWWVADVRSIELFVTAAAMGLIVLHIQGVFTGMKNALVVVLCTIVFPLLLMVCETFWLRASAWQHYFMVGPKYW
eukprot:TRINITY_DN11806_c0_g1_i2.p1 TRINITY_DN11806_c0_g1~~TRINITY_DN11806_c0_g1_i2.p1  ORF type:complete len:455 (+),score=54.66 TRINITY_DN11806_c0_g1_i2:88-1365(+)